MSPEQANTWMATKQQWPTAQDCSRSPTQSAPGATPPSGGPTDPTRMTKKARGPPPRLYSRQQPHMSPAHKTMWRNLKSVVRLWETRWTLQPCVMIPWIRSVQNRRIHRGRRR